jgi:cytochrome oxidase Cu insertion factor (SCO1/SenC/PrrC family)
MPQPPVQLEPVTPDPRKLWMTALILVVIMIVGAVAILGAYRSYNRKHSTSDRPAMNSNRLTPEKDLPLVRQDGGRAALLDLSGKVILIQVVSSAQPGTSERTNGVMKRMAEQYAANDGVALVSLVVDPGPPEKALESLTTAAAALGATLPKWWVGTNQQELLHKYVKKEFKASVFPHQEDGKWVFDTSLVLLDRNGIVRQPVVPQKRGGSPYVGPFDFDQAASWDERGIKTGTGRSNYGELEALLGKTIDILLTEPVQKPSDSKVTLYFLGAAVALAVGGAVYFVISSRKRLRNP